MSAIEKPMAEALKQLKAEMSKTVELDVERTYAMFVLGTEEYDTFTRDTLTFFFDKYRHDKAGRINRAISKIADSNDEILLGTLAGKLVNKLPLVYVPGHPGDYNEKKARLTVATQICHCLMDAGTFKSKIQHKKNAEGQWETLTYFYLGGEPRKELLKGLSFEPGVATQTRVEGVALSSKHKKRLKRLASMPFELSDIATAELIYHLYTLKDDWNKRVDKDGRKLKEDHNTKKERYREYSLLIEALENEIFYLELKYAGSGRMFYRLQLEGIRPQGKLWETLMIDSHKAYHLTEEQQRALKHMIYCVSTGERVTPLEAERRLTDDIVAECLVLDIEKATNEEEAGEMLLLYKAAIALEDARRGNPTKYLFGWDFTNSGVIMAGISFHEEKMMNAGNIHNRDDVVDSHTAFGDGFGMDIPRKDVKKIHMPMLHGASLYGITNAVNGVSEESFTQTEVLDKLEDAYGPSVRNLIDIADWGVAALHNEQTTFRWTLPDGFRATHKAYYQSVPVYVTVASAAKEHDRLKRTSHTITMDMPYAMDNTGAPLIKVEGRAPKVRGLYANITHSIDSFVLRHVADVLLDSGIPFLLKHDDYMVHPSCYEVVMRESKAVFNVLYNENLYARATSEIAKHAKSKIPAPVLVQGNANNCISEATAYLMP